MGKKSLGRRATTEISQTRPATSRQYDYLNRLTEVSSTPSAAYTEPATFNYDYNSANQRVQDTLADGSYWVYQYDSLGQVTNGVKYFSDGTPVAGQQFGYQFDTIGNRTQTTSGGDQNGQNLRVADYSANALNQVTSRDIPPYVDVIGESYATNVVTVNGQSPYRNAEYFREELPVDNESAAQWTDIVVTASVGGSVTGSVYVAREPEQFEYDADGNLTNDGRWAYVWDGENRLIQMTVNTNVGPQYKLTFAYDWQGRRIQKTVATNGVTIYTDNYLYDGWNLIATLNSPSSILASYVWGNDLSGTPQGAGGVGGLLEVIDYGVATNFVAYDGNGNVAALVNAANGTLTANYEYGPFGEPIRITGVMGYANPFRFSTKYDDDESDLLYYGYRYYKPSTGTWASRDPINEIGSASFADHNSSFSLASPTANLLNKDELNIYCFVSNDGINWFDTDGQATAKASAGAAGSPRFLTRSVYPASPPFPRCGGACGYTCMFIIFELKVTDASDVPVPGIPVSEKIKILASNTYIPLMPLTGTATTNSKGEFYDEYHACFFSPHGYVKIQQTISTGALQANLFTSLEMPCKWWGTAVAHFH